MIKNKIFAIITALAMTFGMTAGINAGIFPTQINITVDIRAAAESSAVKDLDMSSRQAFINDVRKSYHINISDRYGYLSGNTGRRHMRELNKCLSLFSPDFIKKLVAAYAEYDSRFIIRLERPSEDDAGYAKWDGDFTIGLHYDKDPDLNGITAGTLAHELGHAIHFMAEEEIGERRSEREMKSFNGRFSYAGSRYERVWNERSHGTTFAYDYAMYDYYEDIACIFEMLVSDPEGMKSRLLNPRNRPLFLKTRYIRDMAYKYISDECSAVFAPLPEKQAQRNVIAALNTAA